MAYAPPNTYKDRERFQKLAWSLEMDSPSAWVRDGSGKKIKDDTEGYHPWYPTTVLIYPSAVRSATGQHRFEGVSDENPVASCERPKTGGGVEALRVEMRASGALSGEEGMHADSVLSVCEHTDQDPIGLNKVTIVARDPSSGQAVGFLSARMNYEFEDGGVVIYHVHDVHAYVAETHRKLGFGATMMTCLLDQVENDIAALDAQLVHFEQEVTVRAYVDIRNDNPASSAFSEWMQEKVEDTIRQRMHHGHLKSYRNRLMTFDPEILSDARPAPKGP
jgi:GNAT superfamily N-acetyltransferase